MSTSPSSSKSGIVLHLPRRLLAIVGIAFAVGLLLFLVVWLVGRKDNDFYKPQPAQVQQETEQVKPLPEPLPAGSAASSMPQAKPVPADETPKLVETAPTPPPTTAAPVPAAGADAAAGSNGAAVALAPGDRPVPLEGQTPPPRYPQPRCAVAMPAPWWCGSMWMPAARPPAWPCSAAAARATWTARRWKPCAAGSSARRSRTAVRYPPASRSRSTSSRGRN